MAPRIRIDYDSIEADWIAGVKSEAQLAQEYTARTGDKVTRQGIKKHFEQLSIARNLSSRIAARASAIVAKSIVANSVTPATKKEIVETNAVVVAQVQIAHRTDIQRNRRLAMSLLEELEQATDNRDLFSDLGEMLQSADEKGTDRLNDLYQKVISMPQRIDGVKKLAETLKTLVGMERQAFGIKDDEGDKTSEIADILREIQGNGLKI